MARGDQLARQWRILQALMTSKQGRAVSELAGELSCHRRTVYRDLEALQFAGFPIYTDRVDGRHVWSLLEAVKSRMPIPLTFTELMTLYLSKGMLKPLADTMFHDALASLFSKIRATLPAETIEYLDGMDQVLRVDTGPRKDYGRHRETIEKVNAAIVERRCLDARYYTMSRQKETQRRISPYRIWYFDGALYLVGFCHLRHSVRIFALDRIRTVQVTDERFSPPGAEEVETFMQSSFGAFSGEALPVRIRFHRDVAGYIRERIWHQSQRIVELENGDVIFEARVAGIQEVKYWVLRWGRKAEVLDPLFLRREIAKEAGAVAAQYRQPLTDERKSVVDPKKTSGRTVPRQHKKKKGNPHR